MRMSTMRSVLMLTLVLLAPACGTKAPPPAVTPKTSTLAATPVPRSRSPWPNSKLFAPKPRTSPPVLSQPKRPIRRTPVPTLRS